MTTWAQAGQVIGMLLFFAAMAAIPAIGCAIWYAIKVWFTTKMVKSAWGHKEED